MNSITTKTILFSLVFFVSGGIILPRFNFFRYEGQLLGTPAIYYLKIQINDKSERPVTDVSFNWSDKTSLIMKNRCPYVVDEISDGLYIIAIVGSYESSATTITINKRGYKSYSINCYPQQVVKNHEEKAYAQISIGKIILQQE